MFSWVVVVLELVVLELVVLVLVVLVLVELVVVLVELVVVLVELAHPLAPLRMALVPLQGDPTVLHHPSSLLALDLPSSAATLSPSIMVSHLQVHTPYTFASSMVKLASRDPLEGRCSWQSALPFFFLLQL